MTRRCSAWALLAIIISVGSAYSLDAERTPKRPHISRIAQVAVFSTDVPAAHAFYERLLPAGHAACRGCAKVPENAFLVNSLQSIYLSGTPSTTRDNLVASITLATNDIRGLRRYLLAQKIESSPKDNEKGADRFVSVMDPEKHPIFFIVEPTEAQGVDESALRATKTKELRIIHAGFIVRDRAATEHFYEDILGFRPYWHGGMKEDQTDWVSMQVPDGTDWLEFMVNVGPNPDQRLRGIMNHIAIGVTDIHETEKRLRAAGAPVNEEPKIGRDGKWQLNLYDPDLTRIEFMEFQPVQKPCCSDFTGPHPGPQ